MTRIVIYLVAGAVAGIILTIVAIGAFRSYSMIAAPFVGCVIASIGIGSFACSISDGRVLLIKYRQGGSWINRGEEGFHFGQVLAVAYALLGITLCIYSFVRFC